MDGILVIDKEKNMTSRDVVNVLSKKFHTKKIGHTGTLDPLATGVLVICMGKSTKFVELLTSLEKEYEATVMLGLSTDTLDSTGTILKEEKAIIKKEQIEEVLKKFSTTYQQEVPIYSAIKKDGKKLYEYAREKREVELPKRSVTIFELNLIGDIRYEQDKTIFQIHTKVSKGTYIRSLIRDIALELHTIGVMTELRRISQGNYRIEEAYSLKEVLQDKYTFLPLERILASYKTIILEKEEDIFKIENGALIPNIYKEDTILFKTKDRYLALYKIYEKDKKKMKPWKMF
jgi:tRNA pseudouridine55 synthase